MSEIKLALREQTNEKTLYIASLLALFLKLSISVTDCLPLIFADSPAFSYSPPDKKWSALQSLTPPLLSSTCLRNASECPKRTKGWQEEEEDREKVARGKEEAQMEGRNEPSEGKVDRCRAWSSASQCGAALCHHVLTCSMITHISGLYIEPLWVTHTNNMAQGATVWFSCLWCMCCAMLIC